jgi:hypothetical protein
MHRRGLISILEGAKGTMRGRDAAPDAEESCAKGGEVQRDIPVASCQASTPN